MEEKLYLSLQDGIAAFSPLERIVCRAPLEGAGALCAGKTGLFCADQSGAIWRFDPETLMPQMLACGGPGICDLRLSEDGRMLYALLGDGDSVLMSDAHTCRPLAVNGCGCNPKQMALDGGLLAAAGGESGCVHLYCAQTLTKINEIRMPGSVYGVTLCTRRLFALCLTAELQALLVMMHGGVRTVVPLPGMPGCLAADGESVLAAAGACLYRFSPREGCITDRWSAPGCASRILVTPGRIVLYDPLSECVFSMEKENIWQRICCGVRDICAV